MNCRLRQPLLSQPSRSRKGLTAIETTIALLILSLVSVFVMSVLNDTRKLQIEIAQNDFACQLSRDVLARLKAGEDWQSMAEGMEVVSRFGTDFTTQLMPSDAIEPGVVHVELTITWLSPRSYEQLVFTTTVPEGRVEG